MTAEFRDGPSAGGWAHLSRRARALVGLLREAWKEYQHDRARYLAGAMVYYALVSLLPLLLLLLAGLGLLLRFSDFGAVAAEQVLMGVEARFGGELRETVETLLGRLQRESVVATFLSLVGLLVTASVLFRHLRLTFRAIWRQAPPLVAGSVGVVIRHTFRERAMAFVIVLGGGALLVMMLVVSAVVQWLRAFVTGLLPLGYLPLWLFALPARLAVLTVMLGFLFKLLPPARLRWTDVWLSALLCAGAWILGAELLALYGTRFDSGFGASGAIAGLLVVMVWMNVVSQVLFFGAELCKVVYWRRNPPANDAVARAA